MGFLGKLKFFVSLSGLVFLQTLLNEGGGGGGGGGRGGGGRGGGGRGGGGRDGCACCGCDGGDGDGYYKGGSY